MSEYNLDVERQGEAHAEVRAGSARVVIITGEHSGDALGAKLIDALRARLADRVEFAGVGGHLMEERGFQSAFPLADIAVMGPIAILKQLPTIVSRVHQSVDVALAHDPDIVVIIDAPEFTHPIAKRIRRRRPDIPIVDYVSPTIWAWRPGRAKKMAPYVDHVLALFPFEPAAHLRLGGPQCSYVGHPLTERAAWLEALDPSPSLEMAGLDPRLPLIVVLPGSRRSEVDRLMDVFGEGVSLFARDLPADAQMPQFVVPALPHVRPQIEAKVAKWPEGAPRPVIVAGNDETVKFSVFKGARAALAASGTVTLELAITQTPMVVAYRVDVIMSTLRHLILTETSVLPNLITGERAIPEFHQERCTPDNLSRALASAYLDTPERSAQLAELRRVPVELVVPGGKTPSAAAADIVVSMMARDT